MKRKYVVNWYGKVGGLKLASGEYEYGAEAVYDYTPTKDNSRNAAKTYYYRPANSFIIYNGDWATRPQLYEHNEIPPDITAESREIFRLFAGWDKCTGFVRPDFSNADGHVDVYAVWEECNGIPESTVQLSEMSASQVYAVTRQNYSVIKQRFSMDNPDYVPITLGFDPEFSNVESHTIVNQKRWFGGNSGEIVLIDNEPLRLFAEDAPSFTLAIDFEMRNGGEQDNGKTLLGCYNSEGRLGFRLRCGYRDGDGYYRPVIEWGNQTFDVGYSYPYNENDPYADVRYRDMVVIRHNAGEATLHVYTSNVSQYFNLNGVTRYSKTRSSYAATNTPLVLGGEYVDNDEAFDNRRYGTGYIYWSKIWFDDLGEFNCQRIASWPREQIEMEYYGTQRYYLANGGTTDRSKASFISRSPLYGRAISSTGVLTSDAVWSNSPARMFLSDRLFDSLPVQWQSMIRLVKVTTVLGSSEYSEIETTEDKIFLPAYAEVDTIARDPFWKEQFSNASNEGSIITWFSDFARRAKSKVLNIRSNANVWTGTTDPTSQIANNVQIGDIWVQTATGGYPVYVFVYNTTIARDHLTVRSSTIQTDVGGWVQSNSMWGLRTPYSGILNNDMYQFQYYVVTALGVISTAAYSTADGIGNGIAIDFCFSI